MIETKIIPGYENYECDIYGNIYSLNYNGTGERRKMKLKLKKNGYIEIKLFKDGKRNYFLIHRLVMLTFKGESDLQVNHINGVKADNRLVNLEYCTVSENAIHAFKLGLRTGFKGGKNGASKLTESQVIEIKTALKNYQRGMNTRLGEKYNVNSDTIGSIGRGETWAHIIID